MYFPISQGYNSLYSVLLLLTAEAFCLNKLDKYYIKSRLYTTLLFLAGCYIFSYFYFTEKSQINYSMKQLHEYDNKIEHPDDTVIKYSII